MEIQIFINRTKGERCGHRLNVTTSALYFEVNKLSHFIPTSVSGTTDAAAKLN